MPELTLKALEHLLDKKLDEKLDAKLQPIKAVMANLATNEELQSINKTLAQHTQLLNRHTTLLDSLGTDVKTLLDEKTITVHRFDRLEHWAQQVGKKLGIKLEL